MDPDQPPAEQPAVQPEEPPRDVVVARLRLRRGPGLVYGVLAVVVGVIVVLGAGSYLSTGSYVFGVGGFLVGGGVTAFLVGLSLSILVPWLDVDATRVVGRIGVWLDLGEESISIDIRSWVGIADFTLLVASTPAPSAQLTPAARREAARLLQLDDD